MKKTIAVLALTGILLTANSLPVLAGTHCNREGGTAANRTYSTSYACPYGYEACTQNGACLGNGTCPNGSSSGRGSGYGGGHCWNA